MLMEDATAKARRTFAGCERREGGFIALPLNSGWVQLTGGGQIDEGTVLFAMIAVEDSERRDTQSGSVERRVRRFKLNFHLVPG